MSHFSMFLMAFHYENISPLNIMSGDVRRHILKLCLISLQLANDVMHLRLIIFSFPVGMKVFFIHMRHQYSRIPVIYFSVTAWQTQHQCFCGYAIICQILLELVPWNRFYFITTDRQTRRLPCVLYCSQVLLSSHRKECCFHRSELLHRHGTVGMKPADQSSALLSEINQHPSRRLVIEYPRRACYRNVMNLIRSKTGCDPSAITTVIEFLTHLANEVFTAIYLETIQNNVSQKVLKILMKKFQGLIFVWMKAAVVTVFLFYFDECCCSRVSSRNRLWMGWSQLIFGCD